MNLRYIALLGLSTGLCTNPKDRGKEGDKPDEDAEKPTEDTTTANPNPGTSRASEDKEKEEDENKSEEDGEGIALLGLSTGLCTNSKDTEASKEKEEDENKPEEDGEASKEEGDKPDEGAEKPGKEKPGDTSRRIRCLPNKLALDLLNDYKETQTCLEKPDSKTCLKSLEGKRLALENRVTDWAKKTQQSVKKCEYQDQDVMNPEFLAQRYKFLEDYFAKLSVSWPVPKPVKLQMVKDSLPYHQLEEFLGRINPTNSKCAEACPSGIALAFQEPDLTKNPKRHSNKYFCLRSERTDNPKLDTVQNCDSLDTGLLGPLVVPSPECFTPEKCPSQVLGRKAYAGCYHPKKDKNEHGKIKNWTKLPECVVIAKLPRFHVYLRNETYLQVKKEKCFCQPDQPNLVYYHDEYATLL